MGKRRNKKNVDLNEQQNANVENTEETNVTEIENTNDSKEDRKMNLEVLTKDNLVQKIGKGIVKAGDKLATAPKPVKIGAKIVGGVALVGAAGAAAVAVFKNKKDEAVAESDYEEIDEDYDDDDFDDFDDDAEDSDEEDTDASDDQEETTSESNS